MILYRRWVVDPWRKMPVVAKALSVGLFIIVGSLLSAALGGFAGTIVVIVDGLVLFTLFRSTKTV